MSNDLFIASARKIHLQNIENRNWENRRPWTKTSTVTLVNP